MSLNHPFLVSGVGASIFYVLPLSEKMVKAGLISYGALQKMNLVCYAQQVAAVSIPGRLDDQVAKAMIQEENNGGDNSNNDVDKKDDIGSAESLTPSSGRTFVPPAGWAFAIWGPIYLGEAVFSISQLFYEENSPVGSTIKAISIPFQCAHLFQSLWCASFRPKYSVGGGWKAYISAAMLGSTAYSLSKVHFVLSTTSFNSNRLEYFMYFFPMSLHFGWTTAATLVNINGALAMNPKTPIKTLSIVGHLSVIGATCLGCFIGLKRNAPVYSSVIAWALFAVAGGIKQRLEKLNKKTDEADKLKEEKKATEIQKKLSIAGAWISVAVSGYSLIQTIIY